MGLRTVTQGQIVAAMLRLIAGQLVKLASTLEEEQAVGKQKPTKRRTPAEYKEHLRRLTQ